MTEIYGVTPRPSNLHLPKETHTKNVPSIKLPPSCGSWIVLRISKGTHDPAPLQLKYSYVSGEPNERVEAIKVSAVT